MMNNCIITDKNSGIGYQAAMQIAEKGYSITMICRNEKAAGKACTQIAANTGNPHVDCIIADLSDMSAV